MLKPQDKEGIIGIAAAVIVFWLLTKTVLKTETTSSAPKPTEENINISLDAYMNAVHDGQPDSVLNELNTSTARDYGLRVYHNAEGHFIVTDLDGTTIRTV